MTNKELQDILKKMPDDALVTFEYVVASEVSYSDINNLIVIE